MTRSTLCRGAILIALVVAFSVADLGQAAPKKSDNVVKVTAKADKPTADGKQVVTVTLLIDKTWHLYANPVGLEDLEGAVTVVTVTGKNKLEDVKVEYPPGTIHKDALGSYKVYEDKVEIKAIVKRAKGDTSALEVTVKLNACDKGSCLLPATVKVPVE